MSNSNYVRVRRFDDVNFQKGRSTGSQVDNEFQAQADFMNNLLRGTITNDNAFTGYIGEYISSYVTNVSGGATGVYNDLTSIPLTPGDWDIKASVVFVLNGATMTLVSMAFTTTAGNSGTGVLTAANYLEDVPPTAATNKGLFISDRLSLAASSSVYLKTNVTFSAGTPKYYGKISARRMR